MKPAPPGYDNGVRHGQHKCGFEQQRSRFTIVYHLQLTWRSVVCFPGIHLGIAQVLFGEIGPDFRKFRSASAFASWMGLCPDNEISGGKVLWVGTRKLNCRAATALRMAA